MTGFGQQAGGKGVRPEPKRARSTPKKELQVRSTRSVENIPEEPPPTADLSTALRYGRDDKGKRGASRDDSCVNKGRFSSPWAAQGP
jgi:hypothetical protein